MMQELRFVFWVFQKELKEIVRNRRALLEMILIPFFLTPILTLVVPFAITAISTHYFQQEIVETIPASQKGKRKEKSGQKIVITGQEHGPELTHFFKEKTNLKVLQVKDIKQALRKRVIHGVIEIMPGFQENLLAGKEAKLRIIVMPVNIKGIITYMKIRAALDGYFTAIKEKQKKKREKGLKYNLEIGTLSPKKDIAGFVLSLIAPTFFIFWMMMGGNSIAIDVTAGEKERRTLEGLLVLPLKRWHILGGKFLTATLAALFSVTLATLGMILPMALFFGKLPPSWRPYLAAYIPSFWQWLGLFFGLSSLAFVLSGIQVFLGFLSRSVKEAEYFLYPLVLPVVLPSALAIFLELSELRWYLFFIPILGNALMIREVVAGVFNGWHFLISTWASFCTASFFLYLAWEMLSQDKVLFTLR